MDTLLQDLRHAVRMLVKHLKVIIVAVLTLALGIGGNTAIFSAISATLLQSLPFAQSQNLVLIDAGRGFRSVSGGDWAAVRQQANSLALSAHIAGLPRNCLATDCRSA